MITLLRNYFKKKDCNIMIGRFMECHKGNDSVHQALYNKNGYPCVLGFVVNTKFYTDHPFRDDLIKK